MREALCVGCGGDERAEYQQELTAVGATVSGALDALPQDDDTVVGAAEVAKLADELEAAADQLDELDPPEDVAAAHRRLLRGLRGVAKTFDALARDLDDATTESAKAELFVAFATDERVNESFTDLIGAQEAFAAKDYRIFAQTPTTPRASRAK